jgi:protoheme IX farnesyltransferase
MTASSNIFSAPSVILAGSPNIIADQGAEDDIVSHVTKTEHAGSPRRAAAWFGDYLELAKARLATLVVLTTIVGYVLAARGAFDLVELTWTVLGTTLTAFGANILNQWIEADRDLRMERTRNRPLPAGRVSRRTALTWGLLSALAGLAVLDVTTNRLTAALSLFVILLYVLVYTPLKTRTPLNTAVGAVCGAVPPMMGWAAATGTLELGAWILGGILFIWQVPHFLALAWIYRDDYARGGFRMMPAADPDGSMTGRAAFIHALALLPVTGALAASGASGVTYLVASQVVGLAFAGLGWAFARQRGLLTARRLFLASIVYLPVLLGLMVTDMDDRIARIAGFRGPATTARVAIDAPRLAPPEPSATLPTADR